jgi:hypothetical protein
MLGLVAGVTKRVHRRPGGLSFPGDTCAGRTLQFYLISAL